MCSSCCMNLFMRASLTNFSKKIWRWREDLLWGQINGKFRGFFMTKNFLACIFYFERIDNPDWENPIFFLLLQIFCLLSSGDSDYFYHDFIYNVFMQQITAILEEIFPILSHGWSYSKIWCFILNLGCCDPWKDGVIWCCYSSSTADCAWIKVSHSSVLIMAYSWIMKFVWSSKIWLPR